MGIKRLQVIVDHLVKLVGVFVQIGVPVVDIRLGHPLILGIQAVGLDLPQDILKLGVDDVGRERRRAAEGQDHDEQQGNEFSDF